MKFLDNNKIFWAKFAQEDRMCPIDQNVFCSLVKDLFLKFKDKKVLDYACGTGRMYPLFISSGVKYFGTDICPEVLELFKQKHPEANFQLDAEFEDGEFDIIWAWSLFTHYPLKDVEEFLIKFKNLIKKDGEIYFSYIPSCNPEEDCEDVGFFTHRKENIEKILQELGLKFEELNIEFPKEGMDLRQKLVRCIL